MPITLITMITSCFFFICLSNYSKCAMPTDIKEWTTNVVSYQAVEEARMQVLQMEKTMRWWADCTANWREKWSKMRNERNAAREEVKSLEMKLREAINEMAAIRRQRQTDDVEMKRIRAQLEGVLQSSDYASADTVRTFNNDDDDEDEREEIGKNSSVEEYVLCGVAFVPHAVELEALTCDVSEVRTDGNIRRDEGTTTLRSFGDAASALKIYELENALMAEREEKLALCERLDALEADIAATAEKREELESAERDGAVVESVRAKDSHEANAACNFDDDSVGLVSRREDADKRLSDIRAQLERLQSENASEWGKRERLETERLSLERENKKLRGELRDALDKAEKRVTNARAPDDELRSLRLELANKNKDLNEAKRCQSKMKKLFSEKCAETNHYARRVEQYEGEVKKLRCRVEELKRELNAAEDELDASSNGARKLQRANEDLQEQADNLNVQVEYLKTRLRRKVKTTSERAAEETDSDVDIF